MTSLRVPGLPFDLTPSPGSTWEITDSVVTTIAHPQIDIFIDPARATGSVVNAASMLNAATLLAVPPAGDFQFAARVGVDFNATFDAGVLLLWADEENWAKLCFEFSPDEEPMVVSVVCRGVADDANGFVVPGRSVWLRVSRIVATFADNDYTDGHTWKLIRHFALADGQHEVRVGFEAQAPTGTGCAIQFDEIRYTAETLQDLRSGS